MRNRETDPSAQFAGRKAIEEMFPGGTTVPSAPNSVDGTTGFNAGIEYIRIYGMIDSRVAVVWSSTPLFDKAEAVISLIEEEAANELNIITDGAEGDAASMDRRIDCRKGNTG